MSPTPAGNPSPLTNAGTSSSADDPPPGTPTAPTARPDSFSIHVRSGEFKSIRPPLDWNDIPSLAVLTGVNGSGKTQLLQALAMHYGDTNLKNRLGPSANIVIAVDGVAYEGHDILFLEDFSRPLGSVSTSIARLEQQIGEYRSSNFSDFFDQRVSAMMRQLQPDVEAATTIFKYFYHNPMLTERAFAHHCTAYMCNCANALLAAKEEGVDIDLRARFGLPPWEEFNSWLEEADFEYRVQDFKHLDIMGAKPITLRHEVTSEVVTLGDLSTGETSIVRFLLLIYAANKEFFCPKLIILDEPDAHLHPSLIHSFLKLLGGLVTRHGCRIIMSTHRVETIGFAPEGSVYVMHRDVPRIRCCDDKLKTIGMLTGNLYGLVLAGKRPIFVEDDDDASFYTIALKVLQRDDTWVGPIVPEYVSIARWASVRRRPGGNEGVGQAVKVMVEAGLEGHIAGLVDRDEDGGAVPPIHELERYAIENYLLDPIVIYVMLLDRGSAPVVRLQKEVTLGEESGLRDLAEQELQEIANAVLALYEPTVPEDVRGQGERVRVTYTNGKSIEVPMWLLRHEGHRLRGALTQVARGTNNAELLKAFEKVKMIPVDLRKVMLQAVGVNPDDRSKAR